ncbi:hypothetical protein L7F22_054682 [Adiantum nelumboides]|nr:hypothetical protein [Adiantum nelumboides]
MVRASSQGRQPVIETDPWDSTVFISRYNKSSSRRVVCKLCGDVLTGGVTQLKAHYSWIGSKGKESCKSVTEDLWLAFGGERARYITNMPSLHGPILEEALLEKVQAEKAKLATHHHPLVAASSAPQASTPNVPFVSPTPRARSVATSVEDSNVGGDATQGSIDDVDASQATTPISTTHTPPQPQVQQHIAGSSRKRARGSSTRSSTLHDVWAPSLKKQAEIAEERFFYQCNIAFHASRTGAYKRFVNAVSAAAAAGAPITLARSEALRTSRLTRQRSDRVLLTGWNTYVERIYRDNGRMQNQLEEDLLEYRGGKGNFSRGIAKDENQALPVSWWEKFGGLNPAFQCLALRVLSQEVSSSSAERLWSIMGDIHTKDRNRLNIPQLNRLAFVNANLRVLEKAGGLEGIGPISWLPKQVDHRQIVVEAADVSQLQPRTPEDDVYDFIREDMMRFSRQTRSTTHRLRGESVVGTSSARPQRAARARRRTRSVAELTSASRRLSPTPSECESDDSCESDGSEE